MPGPCLCLLANSRPARSWSNHPPSPAGGLLLTVVCRPLTGVMTWNDRHLVRDMIEVVASMCAGLYGRRSARRRAEAGLRCVTAEVVEVVAQ
jgi:hypothetical protein